MRSTSLGLAAACSRSPAPKAYDEALAIDAQMDEPIIRRSRP
jgi:hypothetical protein